MSAARRAVPSKHVALWLSAASAVLALLAEAAVRGAPPGAVGTPRPAAPSFSAATPALFVPALTDGTDVVLVPGGSRPAPRPLVVAATRTPATPAAVAAVALDPAAIRRALPSLVRADVMATRPGPRADAWPDRLVAWELEIPLFNLSGKAWLQQRDNAAVLTLVEGAFAPGELRIRLGPRAGATTVVTCELMLDVQSSNFIFRRVARHDPWAESAMTAATAWILLRAVVLAAETPGAPSAPRPAGPMVPPAANALDGRALAEAPFAALRALGTVTAVRRGAGDRLAWVSTAVAVRGSPADIAARVAVPETWHAFPGWGTVTRLAAGLPGAPGAPAPPARIEVQDDVSLVSLDAVWSVPAALPTRATAVEGDTRGAVLGWDVHAGDHPGSALAILSMNPRIDAAGFVQRRLIAAEPLLEHALGLALTYVDAAAMGDALAAQRR